MASLGEIQRLLRQQRAVGKPSSTVNSRSLYEAYFDAQAAKNIQRGALQLERDKVETQADQFSQSLEQRESQFAENIALSREGQATQQSQFAENLSLTKKAQEEAAAANKISGLTQLGTLAYKAADTKIGGQAISGLSNLFSGGSGSAAPAIGTSGGAASGASAGAGFGAASSAPAISSAIGTSGGAASGASAGSGFGAASSAPAAGGLGAGAAGAGFFALAAYNAQKLYKSRTEDRPGLTFSGGAGGRMTPGGVSPAPAWKSDKFDFSIGTKDLGGGGQAQAKGVGQYLEDAFTGLQATTDVDINQLIENAFELTAFRGGGTPEDMANGVIQKVKEGIRTGNQVAPYWGSSFTTGGPTGEQTSPQTGYQTLGRVTAQAAQAPTLGRESANPQPAQAVTHNTGLRNIFNSVTGRESANTAQAFGGVR